LGRINSTPANTRSPLPKRIPSGRGADENKSRRDFNQGGGDGRRMMVENNSPKR
jgi:hypothetical protein